MTNNRRKVAFFTKDFSIGGIEKVFLEYANALAERDFDIYFIVLLDTGSLSDKLSKKVTKVVLHVDWLRQSFFRMAPAIKQHQIDYVISGAERENTVAVISNYLTGGRAKVITSQHNYMDIEASSILHNHILPWILRHSHHTFAVSYGIRDMLLEMGITENKIDVLIIDEAHRVPDSANTYNDKRMYYKGNGNGDEVHNPLSQITSLIYCSKVTVFFIDDKQATKSKELGESTKIEKIANNYHDQIIKEIDAFKKSKNYQRFGVCLNHVKSTFNGKVNVLVDTLNTQFRCIGGDRFVSWLDEVLYKQSNQIKIRLTQADLTNYDFRIFDNPIDLYDIIKSKDDPQNKKTARLCAGWCWPWGLDADANGDLKKEVDLSSLGFNFAMPWETQNGIRGLKKTYKDKYAPDTNSWPSHPMGINQVGCIYTAQGFEFDYVGVILGPDIRYDNQKDCLVCDRNENKESVMTPKTADVLIRNIYRVLMTRGKYGCYIFCCDPNVAKYFKRFII